MSCLLYFFLWLIFSFIPLWSKMMLYKIFYPLKFVETCGLAYDLPQRMFYIHLKRMYSQPLNNQRVRSTDSALKNLHITYSWSSMYPSLHICRFSQPQSEISMQNPQVQKADSWVIHGFLTMQKVSAPNPCIVKGSAT